MQPSIKEIEFAHPRDKTCHIDLVSLQKVLQLQPKDHDQFDHHKLGFYVLLFIDEGTGTHSINYKDHRYEQGTVSCMRKHTVHRFHKSNAKGKILIFTEDFAVRFSSRNENYRLFQLFNELLGSPKLQLTTAEFETLSGFIGHIGEELWNTDTQATEIVRNLVQLIVLKLYRIKSVQYRQLSNDTAILKFIELQERIENECFEQKSVTYYATTLGVSTKTLNNVTRKIIGKNTKAFIDEILILRIKRLLANSKLTMTEIAYRSGFDEPTNFFKFFRKRTGISPKAFQKQLKTN